ncbi:FecR family protein [Prevotella sp. 10(H)]|uniref:FecR family protein n=1 Tax=Prevotella sp. 10(H) TaxID=1158294 RepID=UPI0035100450
MPVGGEYELKLEDGTKVYLNSGTKLTYPSQFNEDKRTVSLTGEAYFDVANNGQPFIVHTNDVDIKVLGTSFNVSAYKEDSFVNTTLINGKVQVKVNSNHSFFDMNPGYNLAFQKETGKVVNAKVDTELYTAWRKGEFFFKGQTLDQIFAKLSRWYDFTVEYQDPDIRYERFTGGCDKHNPIDVFLKQIELVTNIKHTKNGSRITVYR